MLRSGTIPISALFVLVGQGKYYIEFLENGAMLGYREYHAAHELHPAMREDAAEFLTHQLNRLDARIAVTTVG